MGKVLEHGHLAHKVLWNLASWKDGALTQLCIVMDGPGGGGERENTKHEANVWISGVICRIQRDHTHAWI